MDIPRRVQEYIDNAPATPKCFISYIDGESNPLSLRTFAYKKNAKKTLVTEVMRETVGRTNKSVANIYFARMAGYIPVYENKDKVSYCGGYRIPVFEKEDFDKWYSVPLNEFNISSHIINLEALQDTQYKYCGITTDWNEKGSFISHLNKYSANPRIELLGKLGFNNPSKRLISKCEKDKQFVRYLYTNASSLKGHSAETVIKAYKQGTIDFSGVAYEMQLKRDTTRKINNPYFSKSKISRTSAAEYLKKYSVSATSYGDYIEAITELGLDLTDTKNTFPKDFKRMHDLRIDEYAVLKMKRDKEKNKKLWQDFEKVSTANEKYRWECESYVIVMPHTVEDLVNEGNTLHHCVGRMGYEKKVIDGRSIIGFFRAKDTPEKHYCTVELDGKTASIIQAHTDHNGTPNTKEYEIIKQWSLFVKELIKKQSLQNVN